MTTEPKGLTDAECDAISAEAVQGYHAPPRGTPFCINTIYRLITRAAYAAGAASVPREPSQAMIDAGFKYVVSMSSRRVPLSNQTLREQWQAMYDAAQREGKCGGQRCDQSGEVAELGATLRHDSEAPQRVATPAMSDKRAVTGTPETTSPDPTLPDDLVERLRRHCNKCLRCCDERTEAAARIVELEARCAELELTIASLNEAHAEACAASESETMRAGNAESEVARLTQERDEYREERDFLEHNEREWQSLEEAQEHAKAECERFDAALKELDAL